MAISAPPCIPRILFLIIYYYCYFFVMIFLLMNLLMINQLATSHPLQQQPSSSIVQLLQNENDRYYCGTGTGNKCGSFQIPFPFYLNTSLCNGSIISDAFRLSCQSSTSSLFLNIGSQNYRILQFFHDGVLIDFPNTSSSSSSCGDHGDRPYIKDLNTLGFEGNDYFGISTDNVVGLYDCEDSSLCKTDCYKSSSSSIPAGNCLDNANSTNSTTAPATAACCYPLSDGTYWQVGDGFTVFSQFGCRGFSCWVVVPSGGAAENNNDNDNVTTINIKLGVKLEWAVPRNSSTATCAANAYIFNATSVPSGVRCQCQDGYAGDAFALGVGCFKSCLKDGRETYGNNCFIKGHEWKKVRILAGFLTSAFTIASLTALFCLLKRHVVKSNIFGPDQGHHIQGVISFRKAIKTRLFAYHELEEATKGFDDGKKLAGGTKGTLYAGVLGDGSHIAVQKVHCESEGDLIQVLSRVEVLSAVPHRNLARLLGCCVDSTNGHGSYTPLVVYEYPANGTLEEYLRQSRGQQIGLDWYKRLNIASETALVLAFLQYKVFPPIFHHDLKSGCIFLEEDFSVKIAGFDFGIQSTNLNPREDDGSHSYNNYNNSDQGSQFVCTSDDVYRFGVVLVDIITGSRPLDLPTIALQKIKSGKLEEIVDPLLYYHEQPPFQREQIEIVADLATRCLLFGRVDGILGMIDVARELVHFTKDSMAVDGCSSSRSRRGPAALEETFSNSSLLQMISMSPDSIYVP